MGPTGDARLSPKVSGALVVKFEVVSDFDVWSSHLGRTGSRAKKMLSGTLPEGS